VADVSRFNPFQLVSAIHDAADDRAESGGAARIQRMLDGLRAEGEALPLVLWVIANEIRLLARIRGITRSGRPPPPGMVRELERVARRHTADSLQGLLLQAAEIDRMIKGLNPQEPWDALAELARGLAGSPLMKAA
jgi:DNA polymerase-3 subunit delta